MVVPSFHINNMLLSGCTQHHLSLPFLAEPAWQSKLDSCLMHLHDQALHCPGQGKRQQGGGLARELPGAGRAKGRSLLPMIPVYASRHAA